MIFPEIFPKTGIKFISGNANEVVSKIVHEIYPGNIHKLSWNWTADMLKVALSQKILENFYISNINIPNHYPEQKIWISRLKQ